MELLKTSEHDVSLICNSNPGQQTAKEYIFKRLL
uniref:Uncharacterized protein n=1 Tax=Anguilla anguilla TaxID=7936 RepID=A0A0E9VC64_ANGAN